MTKLGRNDQCPCGSGKKYKRCCLPKHEPAAALPVAARSAHVAAIEDVEFDWDDGLDETSNRVVDLIHQGKLDEAEAVARVLLVRYPEVHDGLERLAMVFEARGDRQQAAEYYRRTLAFMRERADDYSPDAIHWMSKKVLAMEQDP